MHGTDLIMTKIGEKTKLLFAVFIPLILFGALFFTFATFGIQIFFGERSDALSILNGVVQGLSTIIAILFSIIILVVQTTLGKYLTKATRYVISDWVNILMLFLYVCTITSALWTMWNINYGLWTVWVDVTMTASLVCLGALIPFFLRMPHTLNPTIIMNQVKNEILNACEGKDFKLMGDKTNLLFSMTRRSIETGDVEYAFEGFRILEEIVRLEDSGENRWMFFNLMQSLLDNMGMENLTKNPNVTLRIFGVYSGICDKVKEIPPIFVNVADRIVRSVIEICREAKSTRFAGALLFQGFFIIIDAYKTDVLLDYYFVCLMGLDESLREILKMSREAGVLDRFLVGFPINDAVMELLRKGKNEEASHMLEVILAELVGSPSLKLSIMGLIIDSKVEGFDDFASKSLEIVKRKFVPFEIVVTYDADLGEGRREASVKPDGSLEIKTGDKKRKKAALWIKQKVAE